MKIPTTTDIPQRYTWCLAGICYSSLAILPSFLSYAESYFNPAFLLENGTSVADLSRFERGNHQPAGVYRVDLWRNDEFIGSQDIVFESTTENTGDNNSSDIPALGEETETPSVPKDLADLVEEPEESDNSTPEGPIENEQSVSDAVIDE